MAALVKALSTAGFMTTNCCDGHGQCPPEVEVTVAQNAIWYEIIHEKYLDETDGSL